MPRAWRSSHTHTPRARRSAKGWGGGSGARSAGPQEVMQCRARGEGVAAINTGGRGRAGERHSCSGRAAATWPGRAGARWSLVPGGWSRRDLEGREIEAGRSHGVAAWRFERGPSLAAWCGGRSEEPHLDQLLSELILWSQLCHIRPRPATPRNSRPGLPTPSGGLAVMPVGCLASGCGSSFSRVSVQVSVPFRPQSAEPGEAPRGPQGAARRRRQPRP